MSNSQKHLTEKVSVLINRCDHEPFTAAELHFESLGYEGGVLSEEDIKKALDVLVEDFALINPDHLSDDWYRRPSSVADVVKIAGKMSDSPLSETMKNCIARAVQDRKNYRAGKIDHMRFGKNTIDALKRRGLAEWKSYPEDDERDNGWFLTGHLHFLAMDLSF